MATCFAAGGLLLAWQDRLGTRRARWVVAFAAALVASLWLTGALAWMPEAADGVSVQPTQAFGPVTSWPAVAIGFGPLRAVMSLAWALVAVPTCAVLAGRFAHGHVATAVLATLAWTLVSFCPGCSPLLGQADPLGPWASTAAFVPMALALAPTRAVPGVASDGDAGGVDAGLASVALAFGLPTGGAAGQDGVARLFSWFNVAALVVGVSFFGALGWLLWRHREGRIAVDDPARPAPPESVAPATRRAWEAIWVAFPALVLAVLAVASFATAPPASPQAPAATIHVEAMQWAWRFADGNATGHPSTNDLHLRVGVPVRLDVTSLDVLHSLFVPDLGLRVDAVPGRTNSVVVTPLRAGSYAGECAEFCGYAHPTMRFTVSVS